MQLPRYLPLAFVAACASPREASMSLAEAEAALHARTPEPALVADALALADLDALALTPPTETELRDPSSDGYWHGAAYAFAPAVRDARAEALAALALEPSAGAPGDLQLRAVDHEFGGDDVLLETVFTFDLAGLLGMGAAEVERRLARTESVAALVRLERALWDAPFAVDRARVELAAANRRVERLDGLIEAAREDLVRIEILERNGRVGRAAADAARGRIRAVEVVRQRASEGLVRRRSDLTLAAGLPLDRLDGAGAIRISNEADAGPPAHGHPRLREARVELAVAEARLRAIAAQAWPGLRLGPHLGFPTGNPGDDVRVGGVLSLSLPFPSRYEGPLEAAAVERDRIIERYAEVVLALGTELTEARSRFELAQERGQAARDVDQASAGAWSATRASFRAGRGSLGEWSDALERRLHGLNLNVDAQADLSLAALDQLQARGPVEVLR